MTNEQEIRASALQAAVVVWLDPENDDDNLFDIANLYAQYIEHGEP